ncbi:TraB/GumN family protein [Mesobacterium sp. TK19101]|uniref:TraB/GumN family protein n=1 Tax=Mesobacterium hydrothermale TaxID=3111907 RepID=A0ABU6HLF2_9RHOB|nr:TraB/GumN family protein [Mesobacterium sp. TK19101]MEC3863131.1 TraB/GumN family protein [Mesobacterium sp. TK19101]
MFRLAAFLFLSATATYAECVGEDLRRTMNDAQRAAVEAEVAKMPYPSGNHWLATKGDARIHLIGTLHIDDPRFGPVVDILRPVIETADIVLFEMDKTEEARMKTASSSPGMIMLDNTSLIDMLPPEDWEMLASALQERGIPRFMAARFQPWYLGTILSMPPCLVTTLKTPNGLDHRLMRVAEDSGVPTGSLENYETVFKLLSEGDMETQLQDLVTAARLSRTSTDTLITMLNAYFEQDIGRAWSAIMAKSVEQMQREGGDIALLDASLNKILNERNEAWIPVILEATNQGTVVTAFGAAHLQGDRGVLNLLAQKGFTLTRQPF